MGQVFRPRQTRKTLAWGFVFLAIVDIPLVVLFYFGAQGHLFFLVIIGVSLVLINGLVLSLACLGKRMSYTLGENVFTVHCGLSKRTIPYSAIRSVSISHITLPLRLFGASWPGLHWGLYNAKDVGRVWVYATKMRGDFIVLDLVNG